MPSRAIGHVGCFLQSNRLINSMKAAPTFLVDFAWQLRFFVAMPAWYVLQ